MFPALRGVETARLTRGAIMDSDVKFENWDLKLALRYLFVVGGLELLMKAGLSRLCPTWLGEGDDLTSFGGSKFKDPNNWRDTTKEILNIEAKKIIATVMEVVVNLAFATYVYEFCGRYFIQLDGGPIGLRSTASLASLIMKIWDTAWLNLLKREMIEVLLYFCYVDDIRNLF